MPAKRRIIDTSYNLGSRAAWLAMLGTCLKHLGYKGKEPEISQAKWAAEREATVQALRGICAEFGDNDWDEHLHLADVVDKHLGDYLHQGKR